MRALDSIPSTSLRYLSLRYLSLRYLSLRYLSLRYLSLRYLSLRRFPSPTQPVTGGVVVAAGRSGAGCAEVVPDS